MEETLTGIGVSLLVIYILGAVIFARRYYVRRHGVGVKFDGTSVTIGHYAASAIALTWPVTILMSGIRNPRLCSCPNHVLARRQAEQEADSVREQLDRERGGGIVRSRYSRD